MEGIDVSKYQGTIDWKKVKDAGVDVAIIRCGWGDNDKSQDDKTWETNYKGAKEAGLKVGVYLYSYANSVDHATSEAQHVIRLLQGKTIDYPIFYDLEDEVTQKCNATLIADMASTFINAIQKAGYKAGIYSSKYWFTSILTDKRFEQWDKWVAQWSKKLTYNGSHIVGWQYASNGRVDGITTDVDMSEWYIESESSSEPATTQPEADSSAETKKSVDEIANEVIAGKWANGEARKTKLTEAGYDYATVQARVNEILGATTSKVYTVQKGDTLTKIANANGTTVDALVKLNGIKNPNLIYIGQQIKLN